MKDTTHNGTHSAIDRNDETHDRVAKNTGADCHFPAETDRDHGRSCATKSSTPPRAPTPQTKHVARGLTNFPVRDRPGVGHPVGDIRAPVPGALGRRDGVEIGIGGSLCGGKATLLLTDLQFEAGKASLEEGHVTGLDRLRLDGGSGGGDILLVGG